MRLIAGALQTLVRFTFYDVCPFCPGESLCSLSERDSLGWGCGDIGQSPKDTSYICYHEPADAGGGQLGQVGAADAGGGGWGRLGSWGRQRQDRQGSGLPAPSDGRRAASQTQRHHGPESRTKTGQGRSPLRTRAAMGEMGARRLTRGHRTGREETRWSSPIVVIFFLASFTLCI